MTKARGRGARSARRTGAGRTATGALSLAWRADPLALSGFSTLSLLASATPVSIAWLTKLLIDGLIAKRSASTLIGLMAAIAVLSGLAAVLPHVTQFLRTELDRKVGTRALERLFLAVERIAGRVVEFGDHHVLMRRGGEYRRLFSLQAARYSVNGTER